MRAVQMGETGSTLSKFEITASHANNRATVFVRGQLDPRTAPHLDTCLRQLLAAGCGRIVIDLGAVNLLRASGFEVLFHVAKRSQRDGTEVILRAPSLSTRRLLQITGLITAFAVEPATTQLPAA